MRHRSGFRFIVAAIVIGIVLQSPCIPAQHLQIGDDIDGEAENDFLGRAIGVSADGSIIAIGAPYTSLTGDYLGDVRIYQNESGIWNQLGDDIAALEEWDEFGISLDVSADGSVVAVGAPANSSLWTLAGHVRVFNYLSETWTQIGNAIVGEAAQDRFGTSVSISADGSIVAIGAPHNDGTGDGAGHVRVFENQSGTWTQIGSTIGGEAASDTFGSAVSLNADGSILAIGAPFNDGAGADAGHVRVYQLETEAWTQIGSDIDGEFIGDLSGQSVSLNADGSVLAIGAHYNSGNGSHSGHVRIYAFQFGDWTQIGGDIDGEAATDLSGYSVSLNADGSVVAIGAHLNDGTAQDAGHVRIFQNQSGNWIKIDNDIDGEGAYDEFGYSVGLSADGTIATVGAPNNDGTAPNAGHVRVFALDIDISEIFSDGFESGNTGAWL